MAQPNRKRVEEEIADRILELLDKDQLPPWSKGWKDSNAGLPCNAISNKPYRGINHWLTLLTQFANGYDDPRWLTFKQAQQLGGHVRKGQKSTSIVFWKKIVRENPQDPEKVDSFPFMRFYAVFNVAQTEDCDLKPLEPASAAIHDPVEEAERIIAAMTDPPELRTYDLANHPPCYEPATDIVRVPHMDRYDNIDDYYTTVFHELTHATGHSKRLNRFENSANRDSLHEYGIEELVAGMGSAMLTAIAGLDHAIIDNQASYIQHWRKTIRADKGIVVRAATRAQRAVDLIVGHDPAATPDPTNTSDAIVSEPELVTA